MWWSSRKTKYGGLIKYFGIEKFWQFLSTDDQEYIRGVYANPDNHWFGGSPPDPKMLDSPESVEMTTQTASERLWGWGVAAKNDHQYVLSEKLLLEALKESKNPIDTHFVYSDLSQLYFIQSEDDSSNLQKCIDYCYKDISLLPSFQQSYKEKYRDQVTVPTPCFERLIEIYNEQEEYSKALDVYKMLPEVYFQYDDAIGMEILVLLKKSPSSYDKRFDHLVLEYKKDLQKVKEFVKENETVNKKQLISGLSSQYSIPDYKTEMLYQHALEDKLIYRVKKGRSYQHFVS